MATKRPTTITAYIQAAPAAGRPLLRRLYEILKSVAPEAEEAIKWGTPFFIEPRFLFAFSAHKAHCNFVPTASALAAFREQLKAHQTTKGTLQLPYSEPLPEKLIRRLAERSVQSVRDRSEDSFWEPSADAHGDEAPQPKPATPRKPTKKKAAAPLAESPSRLIDARIAELGDWRGALLGRLRAVIQAADPHVVEEWKWQVPVWSHDGILCTGETYKNVVKLTFANGAALPDPAGLFNSSLDGNTRRAIDFRESDKVDEKALKTLIRAAAAHNKARVRS